MKIAAIVNPRAGGWKSVAAEARQDHAAAVARWIAPDAPDAVQVYVMRQAADGAKFALEAIHGGCETLVAVGGDGTLNDVVQGVESAGAGERVRLGLLPMGTANVLARELKLPIHNPEEAGRILRENREAAIDLGRMGDRWFLAVAGIGFDGAVTQALNMRLKRKIGKSAYALAVARVAFHYPHCVVKITIDDAEPICCDAYLVLVANGGRYAGHYHLGSDLRLDDGLLDVFVCLRRRPLFRSLLKHGAALARGRFDRASDVIRFRAKRIEIETEQPMPIQLDGDGAGTTPTIIEAAPAALRVLVPASFLSRP